MTITHEKIHRNKDGSRTKICVKLLENNLHYDEGLTVTEVSICPKGKRTFIPIVNEDCYTFRKLSSRERANFKRAEFNSKIDTQQLNDTLIEAWMTLEPSYFTKPNNEA